MNLHAFPGRIQDQSLWASASRQPFPNGCLVLACTTGQRVARSCPLLAHLSLGCHQFLLSDVSSTVPLSLPPSHSLQDTLSPQELKPAHQPPQENGRCTWGASGKQPPHGHHTWAASDKQLSGSNGHHMGNLRQIAASGKGPPHIELCKEMAASGKWPPRIELCKEMAASGKWLPQTNDSCVHSYLRLCALQC